MHEVPPLPTATDESQGCEFAGDMHICQSKGGARTLSSLLAELVPDLVSQLGLLPLHAAPHQWQVQHKAGQQLGET